jgi:hypothetical protein
LVEIDKDYLRSLPGQFAPLYESGVVYDEMRPPPGSACGDDDWADIVHVYAAGRGDCEDLACIRIAECHVRWGLTDVKPFVMLQRGVSPMRPNGEHLYHIMVEWPDRRGIVYPDSVHRFQGRLVECPSTVLGMHVEGAA